uniref:Calcitonin peptide-like domain-containing protein n=1 Tax=Xiphophorus couchianus TaxID=32473 RepID=A0A3B5L9W5_9TELE
DEILLCLCFILFLSVSIKTLHHLQKRMCKFSTCHRERLAHKLSVLAGKSGKKTTDVGKNSFGKREIHLPPAQLP